METSNEGFIYVLSNPTFPQLLKIGKTQRSPAERAAELSGVTGIPAPFHVAYEAWISDCDIAEKAIHAKLSSARHNTDREFFQVSFDVARLTVDKVLAEILEKEVTALDANFESRVQEFRSSLQQEIAEKRKRLAARPPKKFLR